MPWIRGPFSPAGRRKAVVREDEWTGAVLSRSAKSTFSQRLDQSGFVLKAFCYHFWVTCCFFVSPTRGFSSAWVTQKCDPACSSHWPVIKSRFICFFVPSQPSGMEFGIFPKKSSLACVSQLCLFRQVWKKLLGVVSHGERRKCNTERQCCWCFDETSMWWEITGVGYKARPVWLHILADWQTSHMSVGKPLTTSVSPSCKMKWLCLPHQVVIRMKNRLIKHLKRSKTTVLGNNRSQISNLSAFTVACRHTWLFLHFRSANICKEPPVLWGIRLVSEDINMVKILSSRGVHCEFTSSIYTVHVSLEKTRAHII